jgi:ABC-type amino acid transport substrate-binding protein
MNNINKSNKAIVIFNKLASIFTKYTPQELLAAANKITDKVMKDRVIRKLYRKYPGLYKKSPELDFTKIFTGKRSPGTVFSRGKIVKG